MTKDPIRVLIVDDEDRFRATTAAILNRRGFNATAVGSGPEAIDVVKKEPIEVVILDVNMPGMDGNEALREIKKIKPDVQVIMLTGHGTPASAVAGLKDGVFDYLTKPCNIELLASKVRQAHGSDTALPQEESLVRDVMVPLTTFSRIHKDATVDEAVSVMLESFKTIMSTGTVSETVHRSVLVMDDDKKVIGVLNFNNLIQGMQPAYMKLLKERPSMADSIHVEPLEFRGFFTIIARGLGKKKVCELMSEAPPEIEADANLMVAVNKIVVLGARRLLVMDRRMAIGVIREQDLFFEIARVLEQARA